MRQYEETEIQRGRSKKNTDKGKRWKERKKGEREMCVCRDDERQQRERDIGREGGGYITKPLEALSGH